MDTKALEKLALWQKRAKEDLELNVLVSIAATDKSDIVFAFGGSCMWLNKIELECETEFGKHAVSVLDQVKQMLGDIHIGPRANIETEIGVRPSDARKAFNGWLESLTEAHAFGLEPLPKLEHEFMEISIKVKESRYNPYLLELEEQLTLNNFAGGHFWPSSNNLSIQLTKYAKEQGLLLLNETDGSFTCSGHYVLSPKSFAFEIYKELKRKNFSIFGNVNHEDKAYSELANALCELKSEINGKYLTITLS